MKNILCYGDSNTFGFNPLNGSRFSKRIRWTGILQDILLTDYKILEEGVNNRTAFSINPAGELYSGMQYLQTLINKYQDIDIFIISLGINDLQFQYKFDKNNIEKELQNFIELSKTISQNIIFILPSQLDENIFNGYFKAFFDNGSIRNSKILREIFNKICISNNCHIIDLDKFVIPSKIDGLHFEPLSHKIIAENIANYIKTTFI